MLFYDNIWKLLPKGKKWQRNKLEVHIAQMHFNYDVQIPFDQLIAKWGLVKERLIRLEITEWMNEMEIEQNLWK